jgi:hypothetical protein
MSPADDTHEEVGALIRAAAARVEAPPSLHAHVTGLQAERTRARSAPRPRLRLGPAFAGMAAAAAALAAVLVLVLGGSSASGPSLADAATYALRPAVGSAPTHSPEGSAELNTAIDGLGFPYWEDQFNLRATGARRDSINGRRAITVDYAGANGARVGYTILAAPTLSVPGSARQVARDETRFAIWHRDGANVVTWRRAGHTCVLASRTMPASRLLDLAAWTGNGKVSGYDEG